MIISDLRSLSFGRDLSSQVVDLEYEGPSIYGISVGALFIERGREREGGRERVINS